MLWEAGSTEFKEFVLRDEDSELERFLALRLDWEKDGDIIEVIFKNLNAQQKRIIILSLYIVERCYYLICENGWDSIDSFINCTFFSDEDISQMKQKLIQKFGRKLVASFLRHEQFRQLDRYLNWAFQSEEEVTSFRQSINYAVPPSFQ